MRVGTRIHNPKPVSSATAGRASGKDLRSTLGHGFAALRADAPREVRFRTAAPNGSGPIQTPLFLNLEAPCMPEPITLLYIATLRGRGFFPLDPTRRQPAAAAPARAARCSAKRIAVLIGVV